MAQSNSVTPIGRFSQGIDPYLRMFMQNKLTEQSFEKRQASDQAFELEKQRQKYLLEQSERDANIAGAPERAKAMMDAMLGVSRSGLPAVATQQGTQGPQGPQGPQATQPQPTAPTAPSSVQALMPEQLAGPPPDEAANAPITEKSLAPNESMMLDELKQLPVTVPGDRKATEANLAAPQTRGARGTAPVPGERKPLFLLQQVPNVSMTMSGKGELSSTVSAQDPKEFATNNLVHLIEGQGASIKEAKDFLLQNGMVPDQTVLNTYGRKQFMEAFTPIMANLNVQRPDLPSGNKLAMAGEIVGQLVGWEYMPTEVLAALKDHKVQMTPGMSERIYAQFGTLDPQPWMMNQAVVEEKFDRANMELDVALAKLQNEMYLKSSQTPIPTAPTRLQKPGMMRGKTAPELPGNAPTAPTPTQQLTPRQQRQQQAQQAAATAQAPATAAPTAPGVPNATSRRPAGGEAQLKYDAQLAEKNAEFDAPKRMTAAHLTDTLKTVSVARDIAGVSKYFQSDLIGPLRGRGDWLKGLAGKQGVTEAQLRTQLQLGANSMLRLYAGLTQSQGESERQALVMPNANEAPEQFIAKYNLMTRQVYTQVLDTINSFESGNVKDIPPALYTVAKELADVHRDTNRAANFMMLPEGSKKVGKSAVNGAQVWKKPNGEFVTLE